MRIRHAVAVVVIPVVMSVAATPSFAGAFDSIERAVAKDVTKAEKGAVKEVGQADKVIVVVVPEGADLASAVRAAVSKGRRPEGEVARIHPHERRITFARGDFVRDMPYHFLVIAIGRRLKTEQVTGFFEHAHHLLGVRDAKKFGDAARSFSQGHAIIGSCPDHDCPFLYSRLPSRFLGCLKDVASVISGR